MIQLVDPEGTQEKREEQLAEHEMCDWLHSRPPQGQLSDIVESSIIQDFWQGLHYRRRQDASSDMTSC